MLLWNSDQQATGVYKTVIIKFESIHEIYYPRLMEPTTGKRFMSFLVSLIDPRSYLHSLRILHFYAYSHVRPRAEMQVGKKCHIAPTVSFRNGSRIIIGKNCHIGEQSSIWAGDQTGRITLGDNVSLAPRVFLTASDYQFAEGLPFRTQPKREQDICIKNDVWLGMGVMVTAGVTLGEGCIIGAGAVVTHDIPGNCIAVGIPARIIGKRPSIAATELASLKQTPNLRRAQIPE